VIYFQCFRLEDIILFRTQINAANRDVLRTLAKIKFMNKHSSNNFNRMFGQLSDL